MLLINQLVGRLSRVYFKHPRILDKRIPCLLRWETILYQEFQLITKAKRIIAFSQRRGPCQVSVLSIILPTLYNLDKFNFILSSNINKKITF